jgi:hypothetical protein
MRSLAPLLVALALPALSATAETPPPPKPTVYALVSAVGGDLTFVRQREQVGSNRVDTYHRLTLKVPDASLDGAVLRGIAKVIRGNEPDAVLHYMRLNPKELEGVTAHRKGEIAIGKLAKAFDGMPERMSWDKIIVITPKYLQPSRDRMGSKLHGLGVYVQPLYSGNPAGPGGIEDLAPSGVSADEAVVDEEGAVNRSSTYVAPYFYTQLWVLDAKTLEVLDTDERYDYQKIHDWRWTSNDVQRNLSPEQLSEAVGNFVERQAARATREAVGSVTVGDPKPVKVGPLEDITKKKP